MSEACRPVLPQYHLCLVLGLWKAYNRGQLISQRRVAYMAIVIQQVIGELQLVERHNLLHPLCALSWRIRVVVHSARCGRICLAGHQPGGAMESIPRATSWKGVMQYRVNQKTPPITCAEGRKILGEL